MSRIYIANPTHLPKLWQALNTFFLHQHLDWQSLDAQIEQGAILCLEKNERLAALLSLSAVFHDTSWVKLFAVRNDRDAEAYWKELFFPAVERLLIHSSPITIYTIANWDWYLRLIRNLPYFSHFLHIITLECTVTNSTGKENIATSMISPIKNGDVATILEIDQAAFQPPWQLDSQNLTEAVEQSTFSAFVNYNDQPAGYILAAATDGSCHLSRIAVKPQYTGLGLGSSLMTALMQYCQSNNIQRITVNTQETNIKSLHLYRKFGFTHTGERIPVFSSRQSMPQ